MIRRSFFSLFHCHFHSSILSIHHHHHLLLFFFDRLCYSIVMTSISILMLVYRPWMTLMELRCIVVL